MQKPGSSLGRRRRAQKQVSDSKLAVALKKYEAAVARSEATRASLEDQVQKPAAAESETPHAQQAVSPGQ